MAVPVQLRVERDPKGLLAQLRREGVLRTALEVALPGRHPVLATGIGELDEVLGGGLPRGRVVELVGSISSGRTAFLVQVLASATRQGEQAALIDLGDTFEAAAAVTAGVVLERVLWIRPSHRLEAFRAADLVLGAGGFGVVVLDLASASGVWRSASGTESREPKAESRVSCSRPLGRKLGGGFGPWPRLWLQAKRSGTVLLALGERREAETFAALVLGLRQTAPGWTGGAGSPLLLDRLDVRIEILRNKGGRPAGPVRWNIGHST